MYVIFFKGTKSRGSNLANHYHIDILPLVLKKEKENKYIKSYYKKEKKKERKQTKREKILQTSNVKSTLIFIIFALKNHLTHHLKNFKP